MDGGWSRGNKLVLFQEAFSFGAKNIILVFCLAKIEFHFLHVCIINVLSPNEDML